MKSTAVLVIHGFGSIAPNESATAIIENTLYHCVAPQLDYKDFLKSKDRVDFAVEELLKSSMIEDIVVLGSSMGGFWAHYVCKRYNLKTVLVNPALLINETCDRCKIDTMNTKMYCNLSAEYDLSKYKPGTYVDILLGGMDDVIDPTWAREHFPSWYILYEEGHKIRDQKKIINMIVQASNNLSQ